MFLALARRVVFVPGAARSQCATCFRNTVKVLMGSGAVYATAQQGVWTTNTDQSARVLSTVKIRVSPASEEYIAKVCLA